MNFFQQLASLSDSLDISLRIKGKDGKFSVLSLPQTGGDNKKIRRRSVTGTPMELDEGFIAAITAQADHKAGLEISDLKDGSKVDLPAKPSAPASKSNKSKGKDKGAKKDGKEGKKASSGPTLTEQSIFDAPAADPDERKTDEEIDKELTEESQTDEAE